MAACRHGIARQRPMADSVIDPGGGLIGLVVNG
jgi:hypothetical protein